MKKFYLVMLFAALFLGKITTVKAQGNSADSIVFDDNDFWKKDVFKWEMIFRDSLAYEFKVPTIELMYGMSNPTYHEDIFKGNLADNDEFSLKLGFTDFRRSLRSQSVIKYNFSSFLVENKNYVINHKDDTGKGIRTDTWNFGFFNSDGYGYRFGEYSSLVLVHGDGIQWSKLKFKDRAKDSADQNALDVFGSALRFGEQWEAGIKLRFAKNIAVSAAYSREMIYPRHMFWYWLWSKMIEGAAQGSLDAFINAIEKSSPDLVPILDFILKNALSYGIYELRAKNMNWPAETAPPFMFNTFRVGLTFTF